MMARSTDAQAARFSGRVKKLARSVARTAGRRGDPPSRKPRRRQAPPKVKLLQRPHQQPMPVLRWDGSCQRREKWRALHLKHYP